MFYILVLIFKVNSVRRLNLAQEIQYELKIRILEALNFQKLVCFDVSRKVVPFMTL